MKRSKRLLSLVLAMTFCVTSAGMASAAEIKTNIEQLQDTDEVMMAGASDLEVAPVVEVIPEAEVIEAAPAVDVAAAPEVTPIAESVVTTTWTWTAVDGTHWVCTDEEGEPMTGFQVLDGGRTYYFDNEGRLILGFFEAQGRTFHATNNGGNPIEGLGAISRGLHIIDGHLYYFENEAGAMATGWRKLTENNRWYYFAPSGAAHTGWLRDGGHWYYMNELNAAGEEGQMQHGWKLIDGQWYYLGSSESGQMLDGWRKLNNEWYYLQPGQGHMVTGWQFTGGSWYYMKPGQGHMVTGWQHIDGKWYLLEGSGSGRMLTGWHRYNGQWTYLEPNAGNMLTGWHYVGDLKYYFDAASGYLRQDVSSMVSGPYMATVNRRTCVVTIYAQDGSRGFTIPVKAMITSVGLPGKQTPAGTFATSAKYRWKELIGPSWGQYATRITGGILFHSVAGSNTTPYNITATNYNRLGSPASSGCVRLTVRDAKWIYDNCALGMRVTISDTAQQPFDKPVAAKIPAGQNWDPTDPAVNR